MSRSRNLDNGTVSRDTANIPVDPVDYDESVVFPHSEYSDQHDAKIKALVEENWNYIRSHSHLKQFSDRHVLRLESTNMKDINAQLRQLFVNQKHMFRINLSFGMIMRHKETGDLRYWHASHGADRLMDQPPMIRNAADFEQFLDDLEMEDILEWAWHQRPNSKWTVDLVTNCDVYIDKITHRLIG